MAELLVMAVSTFAQIKQEKKRAAAETEARDITSANEELRNRAARRKAVREERIRRQRIRQVSVSTGVAGSAGEIGAISALAASVGRNIAFQEQETRAAQGVSAQQQRAATAQSNITRIRAFENLFQTGVESVEKFAGQ